MLFWRNCGRAHHKERADSKGFAYAASGGSQNLDYKALKLYLLCPWLEIVRVTEFKFWADFLGEQCKTA